MVDADPPRAPRRSRVLALHGDERVDDWYWLRQRDDPEVRAYLEAENAYAAAVLAPTAALRDAIFEEIRGRVQETDESAPIPNGPWIYSTRTVEGLQYALWCRRPRDGHGNSVVLLDENELARGHTYFALGGFDVSPDHRLVAYLTDVDGSERFTLRFRDTFSGADLDDRIAGVTYGTAWADDSHTCFYVRPDASMRPYEVWRHVIGAPVTDDVRVAREDDERFVLGITRTRSGRFVLISATSKTTSEVSFVLTDAPSEAPRVVAPREPGHEYDVEHHWSEERGDRFLIVTNQAGRSPNFELVAAPVVDPARQYWTPLVPHRDDVRLDGVAAFAEHVVLAERCAGQQRLCIMATADGDVHEIDVPEGAFSVWIGPNEEFDTDVLRFGYQSLVTPHRDVDYGMESRAWALVKQAPVPGYDPEGYVSERMWATASDGTRIPLSIARRRDTPLDGRAPALVYGYGSYEISIDPDFRVSRLSLLDRGFVFAIAHVRGGGEMGRAWYEDGKLERKEHTFTDFVACAEELLARGYAAPGRLVARGRSAGGLLMGAITNMRPDLFAAVVAEVPFVDVVTTMLDAELPLTAGEWEEWGDPREPDAYEWMKAYSPYDNVADRAYPAILATSGLNDPRVQYWEPAKWVAKLRVHTQSGKPILLRTELGAGHGGPSGRYDAWREEALVLAFVCSHAGVTA